MTTTIYSASPASPIDGFAVTIPHTMAGQPRMISINNAGGGSSAVVNVTVLTGGSTYVKMANSISAPVDTGGSGASATHLVWISAGMTIRAEITGTLSGGLIEVTLL